MSLDVQALRESFELVVDRSPQLTRRFYEIFFEKYPQAKKLFGRNSAARQEEMLTKALIAVIDHLEDAPWLVSTLQTLGGKHVAYGVIDEMYGWVGESLLATLSEVAAEAWTPRIEKAWTDAYGAISGLMLEGARRAREADGADTERSAGPRSSKSERAPLSAPAAG